MKIERINRQNWKKRTLGALEGLFAISFGSLLMAFFADSYGILQMKSFSLWQNILFQIVWVFCVLGVLLIIDMIVKYIKAKSLKQKDVE